MSKKKKAIDGFDAQLLDHEVIEKLEGLTEKQLIAAMTATQPLVRANVARALGVFGWGGEALVGMLDDEDEQVQLEALASLAKQSQEKPKLLIEASTQLEKLSGELRQGLGQLLEDLGRREPALFLEALELSPDRASALLELFVGLGELAIEPLTEALQAKSALLRANAVQGLGLLIDQGFEVDPELFEAAAQDSVKAVRSAAQVALRAFATEEKANQGEGLLPFDGFGQRLLSLEDLDAHRTSLAANKIQQLLGDPRELVRANAALALGMLGIASKKLRSLLQDPSPEVAEATARAYLHLVAKDSEQVRGAIEALVGADEKARRLFGEGLAPLVLGKEAFFNLVMDVTEEAYRSVVEQTIAKLRGDAMPLLIAALRETHGQVRANCARALGQAVVWGEAGAFELLKKLEADNEAMVALAAKAELAGLEGKQDSPSAAALGERLAAELLSAEALGEIIQAGPPEGLVKLLTDGRERVRANAARLLGLAGVANGELLHLLKDSEVKVRAAAIDALCDLGEAADELLPVAAAQLQGVSSEQRSQFASALQARMAVSPALFLASLRHAPELIEETSLAAIEGLGAAALPLLDQALNSSTTQTRFNALLGLERLLDSGIEIETERVLEATSDSAASVREQAEFLVARLTRPKKVSLHEPSPLPFAAFGERVLSLDELRDQQDALEGSLVLRALTDGRKTVRANANLAAGLLGMTSETMALALCDSEPEVRQSAGQALGLLGEQAGPVLLKAIPLLQNASLKVREHVLGQLELLSESNSGVLIEGLRVPPAAAQASILEVFDKLGARGVELLSEAMKRDSALVRVNAIEGLARLMELGEGVDLELVKDALNDPVAIVSETAERILNLSEARRRRVSFIEAEPLPSERFEREILTVEELGELGDALLPARMIAALGDGRILVRANAARALGVLNFPVPQLSLLLRDAEEVVRHAAADGLALLGAEAAPFLIQALPALERADSETRQRVFAALTQLAEAQGELLLEGLRLPLEIAECTSLEVFDRLGDRGAELLLQALKSDSALMRSNAILGLRRLVNLGVGMDIGPIKEASGDSVALVRETADDVLMRLAQPKAATVAAPAALPIPEFATELLGEEKLREITEKLESTNLVDLTKDGRETVRANASLGLGVLGQADASLALALRDSSALVRKAAVEALAALGDSAASILVKVVPALADIPATVRADLVQQIAQLAGRADGLLIEALRIPSAIVPSTIALVFRALGDAANPILEQAVKNDSALIRLNAVDIAGELARQGYQINIDAIEPLEADRVSFVAEAAVKVCAERKHQRKRSELKPELQLPADFSTKLLSLEELEGLASELNSETVIAALQDGRAVVRANAARALSLLKLAIPDLLLLLKDSAQEVQAAAAQSLKALGEEARHLLPTAMPAVYKTPEAVLTPIVEALMAMAGSAPDMLIESLRHPSEIAQGTSLFAFDKLGNEGIPLLYQALKNDSAMIRVNGIIGLQRALDNGCSVDVDKIAQAANDNVSVVREYATAIDLRLKFPSKPESRPELPLPFPEFATEILSAEALVKRKASLDPAILKRALNDGRLCVRANAARALAVVDEAVPALTLALQDSESQVRQAAAEAIGILGPQAAFLLGRIIPVLPDVGPELREHLLKLLVQLGINSPNTLIEALRLPLDKALDTSIAVFGRLEERALPILNQALLNDSALIRANAIHTLKFLREAGQPTDLQAIERVLKDPIAIVRQAAEVIVVDEQRRRKEAALREEILLPLKDFDNQVLELDHLETHKKNLKVELIEALASDGREYVRANAARCLLVLNAPKSILSIMLRDQADLVREQAAFVLQQMGPSAAHYVVASLPALVGSSDLVKEPIFEAMAALAPVNEKLFIDGLRVTMDVANEIIMPIIGRLGANAIGILFKALEEDGALVRINAIRGLELLLDSGYGFDLAPIEARLYDPVSLVRGTAEQIIFRANIRSRRQSKPMVTRVIPFPEFENELLTQEDLAARKEELRLDQVIDLVGDGRARVRANAALSLGVLGHPTNRLLLLLKDSDRQVRESSAQALLILGAEGAHLLGPAAASILGSGIKVRRLLLRALTEVSAANPEVLIEAFRMPPGLAEQTVLQVCDQLKERALEPIKMALRNDSALIRINAIRGLRRLVRAGLDIDFDLMDWVRGDPIELIYHTAVIIERDLRSRKRESGLREAIPHPHPNFATEELSIQALRAKKKALEVDVLKELIVDGRALVRMNAITGLVVLGEPSARLVVCLRDEDERVRVNAAKALNHFGIEARHLLLKAAFALVDAKEPVRKELIEAIHKLVPDHGDLLIEALRMPVSMAESTILTAFDTMEQEGVKLLSQALESDSVLIRLNAARGLERLAKLGVGMEQDLLLTAADDPIDEVRRAIMRIFSALEPKPLSFLPAVELPHPAFESRHLTKEEAAASADGIELSNLVAMLSNGLEVVRANAVRLLGYLGRPSNATLQQILILLRDESMTVRLAACATLSQLELPQEEVVPRVLRALRTAKDDFVEGLLKIIDSFGDSAIPSIIEGLDQPQLGVMATIGRVVTRRSDRLIEPLLQALTNRRAPERLRENAAYLLETYAPRHPSVRAELRAFKSRHKKNYAVDINPQKKRRAKASEPEGLPLKDFELREIPREELAKHSKTYDAERLERALQDGRAIVRINACRALGTLGEKAERSVPQLVVRLRDPDPRVIVAAARSLGLLKSMPNYVVPTTAVVMRETPAIAVPALLECLRAYGEETVELLIREISEHPMRYMRVMPAIVPLFPEQFVAALQPLLQHHVLKVREVAADLLYALGGKSEPARAALLEALKQRDGAVRRYCILALGQLPNDKATVTELKGLMERDYSNSIQFALRKVLHKLTGETFDL